MDSNCIGQGHRELRSCAGNPVPKELAGRFEDRHEDVTVTCAKKLGAGVVVELHQQSKGSTATGLTIPFFLYNVTDGAESSVDEAMLSPQVLYQHYPTTD